MDKKFVYLSRKSLAKVFDWVEQNELTDPLANAYFALCTGVGCFSGLGDNFDIARSAGVSVSEVWEAENKAMQARDMIGRMILRKIRKQSLG